MTKEASLGEGGGAGGRVGLHPAHVVPITGLGIEG